MRSHQALIERNLHLLAQGRELLERLDDSTYRATVPALASRAVGCHFRHCLDFFDQLARGAASGRVDYDARGRHAEIEQDRALALAEIERLEREVRALSGHAPELPIEVNLENALAGSGEIAWSRSTLRRELQALVSHTLHHYALIGLLLRAQGLDAGSEFGVAPSTLEHERRSLASCSTS